MSNPAIVVENLSKCYRLGLREQRPQTFREAVTGALAAPLRRLRQLGERGTEEDTFWALRDVNFAVKPGEVVGIIGRNGAGKSTLLKVLSRIVEPTAGRVRLRGRVASLLEVGTGFHQELTGRENIYMNGSILGMRKAEIDRKFDEIVAFAEVERFLDTPVKRYSSGMYVRLAFAVAAHLEPEILIVDEVLAVGDAQFQDKCLGKMQEVSRGHGRTVLFVSHNMAAVRTLCQRGLLLERGRCVFDGAADQAADRYMASGFSAGAVSQLTFKRPSGVPQWMEAARILCDGKVVETVPMGSPISVEVDFASDRGLQYPKFGLVVESADGTRLINTNNHFQRTDGFPEPVTAGTVRYDLGAVPLVGGRYAVSLFFGDAAGDTHVVEQALTFEVTERDLWGTAKVPPASASKMYWPIRCSLTQSPAAAYA